MFASFNARAIGLTMRAERAIDLAAATGFGGVDLLVRDLVEAGSDPRALRSRMDDLGLRGGAWPLPVDWRGEAGRFTADLANLPRLADAAATLGVTRTCTWVMRGLPHAPDGVETATYLRSLVDLHVERLGAIARVLAARGTRLGLEVIGVNGGPGEGAAGPFYATLGGSRLDSLLAELRRETPSVGILVDAFHLFAAGEPVEVAWSRGIESVVWVHVADMPYAGIGRSALRDSDRGLPGEVGAVESGALLAGLSRRGYDGPVTAEPLAGCRALAGLDPEAAARRTLAALQSVWPGP